MFLSVIEIEILLRLKKFSYIEQLLHVFFFFLKRQKISLSFVNENFT